MIGRGLMAALVVAAGLAVFKSGYGLLLREAGVLAAMARAPVALEHFGLDWWAVVLMGLGCGLVLLALPRPGRQSRPHITYLKPAFSDLSAPSEHAPSATSAPSPELSLEISMDPEPCPDPFMSFPIESQPSLDIAEHMPRVRPAEDAASQFRSKPPPRTAYRTLIVKGPAHRRPR